MSTRAPAAWSSARNSSTPIGRAVATVVACVLTLTACSNSDPGPDNADSTAGPDEVVIDGTLSYAIHEDPGNLFRHINSAATLSYVYPWAYESLVYVDPDGEVQGWLAEDWEESPTELRFTIRDGVKCEDGTDFTAEVVANNFRWIVDPANASIMAGLIVPTDATVEHDNVARTVTLTTQTPDSFLLVALGVYPLYCQGALDDPGSVASATNGTGLFQLTEAVPNDHYTFTRNETYDWPPEGGNDAQTPGVPKEVVIQVVENPSTRANLLLSGELNMAGIQGPDEPRVAGQAEALITGQILTGGLIYSQAEGQPTADEQVRIALTHALDLESLMRVQTADSGQRAPAMAVLPPVICQYDATNPNLPSYDVTEAERLLDEAGWVKGPDGLRSKDGEPLALHFGYNTRWPETASTVELMKQQWEQIGASVTLEGSETNAFFGRIFSEGGAEDFDVIWMASNYNVPSVLAAFVSGPTPPNGNNVGQVSNQAFDAQVAESTEFAGQEACTAWEEAEAALYAAADYVPFAMRPEVTYARGVRATIPETLMAPAFVLVEP